MATSKRARTVLCLGPPHSGKSVFCYILFKFLRGLDNDACVMDGDYYSPTYRRLRIEQFASPDEYDHIISTPNATKLNKLTEENFRRLSRSIHDMIEHRGIIVLDGLGRHSLSTEALLELSEMLIVLCPNLFSVETGSEECFYVKNREKVHPFEFYFGIRNKYIMIKTHFHDGKKAYFDEKTLQGELFDLDKEVIVAGNIDQIPKETSDTILQIAKFIQNNWV